MKFDTMRKASRLGEMVFARIGFLIKKPNMTPLQLNEEAVKTLNFHQATAEFKNYGDPPFPAEVCISINEEVCHGIPDDRKLKKGDLVSVDMGIRVNEYVVDACRTFEIGTISPEADHVNYWTKTALKRAIRHVKADIYWNDIAKIIENTAKHNNLSVVKAITGHGIGEKLHESPSLRNYVCEESKDITLQEGQTICIEPMFALGSGDCEIAENKWTVVTKDKSLSSHWEHCVIITKSGCEILL